MMAARPAWSRTMGPKWFERNYTKTEYMVEMRDGVKLYTSVYVPKDGKEHPVLLLRTPYGLNPYGKTFHHYLRSEHGIYAEHKYILVYQNVRGTYMSEGDFVQVRPVGDGDFSGECSQDSGGSLQAGSACDGAVDDATDTYDTAEWIIANLNTNGNIGVLGVSYNGFYANIAAVSKHPAIKAVSPQAPVTDWFIGDDAHTNGAFQNGMFLFGASFFRERHGFTKSWNKPVEEVEGDCYDWFLAKGALGNLLTPHRDSLEFLDQMMRHPNYDEWWKKHNPTYHFEGITAAALVVGGWYDGEDCYGALETYRRMCELCPDNDVYLAFGPWYHGGWNKLDFASVGDAYFGADISRYYLENIEYPFFAYYLEGVGEKPAHKVTVLPSGETLKSMMEGKDVSAQWQFMECWPPVNASLQKFYMAGEEKLVMMDTTAGSEAGTCAKGNIVRGLTDADDLHPASEGIVSDTVGAGLCDCASGSWKPLSDGFTYISDPKHPVPFMENTAWGFGREYMTADQRFAVRRTDVLTFATDTLKDALHVAGPIKVALRVSMTSTDADMIVKLVDVRPDGSHILVRHGIMPARHRNGLDVSEPMVPGEVTDIEFVMNDINHVFEPGHRLEVLVMSSMYPLVAMNPQTFVPNIYETTDADYVRAEITIHRGSYLELPVLE